MINPFNHIFDNITGGQEQAAPTAAPGELEGRYSRLEMIDMARNNLTGALGAEFGVEMLSEPKEEWPDTPVNQANQTSEGQLKFIATNALDGKFMDEQTTAQRQDYFSKLSHSLAPRREDVINDESL